MKSYFARSRSDCAWNKSFSATWYPHSLPHRYPAGFWSCGKLHRELAPAFERSYTFWLPTRHRCKLFQQFDEDDFHFQLMKSLPGSGWSSHRRNCTAGWKRRWRLESASWSALPGYFETDHCIQAGSKYHLPMASTTRLDGEPWMYQ